MAQSATATEVARPQLVTARAGPPATVGDLLSSGETVARLQAIATKYLPADRVLRLATMAIRRTPRLRLCDPTSFLGSLMSATGLGLEPNTVKGHAFLIPFKGRRQRNGKWEDYYECQFQVGYKGFIALFYRTGLITEVSAEAIYDGDKFEHRKGSENYLRYEKALGLRGDLLGAFCFTRLKDGEAFTVLPAADILLVRSRSQTWRTLTRNLAEAENDSDRARAERLLAETPWVMWEGEMAAKTAIKRHAKQVDIDSPLLAVAADIDGLVDAGALDIRSMADPDLAHEILAGNEPAEEDQGEESGGEPTEIPARSAPAAEAAERNQRQASTAAPAGIASTVATEAGGDASPAGGEGTREEPQPSGAQSRRRVSFEM